jgi:lipoprotein-releasing system ATP-binding protein
MSKHDAGLTAANLYTEFATPGDPLVIIQDLSLTMQRGEALAIMGPSGSGKSTLLYTLGALEAPTRGTVLRAGAGGISQSASGLRISRALSAAAVYGA